MWFSAVLPHFDLSVDSNGCDAALGYEAFKWKRRKLKKNLLVLTQKQFLFNVWKGGKSLWMSYAIVWMASASMQSNCHGGKMIPSETEDRRRIHSEKKDRLHRNGHTQSHTHIHTVRICLAHKGSQTNSKAFERFCCLPAIWRLCFQIGRSPFQPSVSVKLICLCLPGLKQMNK